MISFLVIIVWLFSSSVSNVLDKVPIARNLYQNKEYYTYFSGVCKHSLSVRVDPARVVKALVFQGKTSASTASTPIAPNKKNIGKLRKKKTSNPDGFEVSTKYLLSNSKPENTTYLSLLRNYFELEESNNTAHTA